MRIGTIYSASDKSLYDALNQKKVTNSELRELFITRGILVSKETQRKELAQHFSRLFHDYHDYQLLAKLFGGGGNRDKLSSIRLCTSVQMESILNGAIELKSELEAAGASVKVSTAKGTRFDIEIRYAKVQFNRSEFRQVSNRTAVISFHKEAGGFMVHSPHSDEANEWIDKIVKSVKDNTSEVVDFDLITLPPAMDTRLKTKFFTLLIRNVYEMPLVDVTDVYVTKPRSRKKEDEDEDRDDEKIGSPEIRIDKASLRGKGVLESEELRLLETKGFYVSRIVWTAKQTVEHSDLYEFEAQFASPDTCEDFAYLPRGFYKRLEGTDYSKSRTNFSLEDERRYGRLIEEAARATLEKLPGHPS